MVSVSDPDMANIKHKKEKINNCITDIFKEVVSGPLAVLARPMWKLLPALQKKKI